MDMNLAQRPRARTLGIVMYETIRRMIDTFDTFKDVDEDDENVDNFLLINNLLSPFNFINVFIMKTLIEQTMNLKDPLIDMDTLSVR